MKKHEITIIRTNDITSEGTPIFKFTVWNSKGQMIDTGEIAANCIEHARDLLSKVI